MEVLKLKEISNIVLDAVAEASKEVMVIYNSDEFEAEDKEDGSPVTLADKVSHQILVSSLESIDDSIPVLSEEGDSFNYEVDLFWLIDPLDGTKEFINKNGEFTVNVALVENGIPILGVVSAPAINETFIGFANEAYKVINKEHRKITSRKQSTDHCLVTVSKSHKSEKDQLFIDLCHKEFGSIEELPTGSSLKLCRVAEGKADIYSRLGPTYKWDKAAGQAVAVAAGGVVSDLSGRPLRYEFKSSKKNPQFFCAGDNSFSWKDVFLKLV